MVNTLRPFKSSVIHQVCSTTRVLKIVPVVISVRIDPVNVLAVVKRLALSMFPEAIPLALAWVSVYAQAVLFAFEPPSLVDAIVSPFVVTVTHFGVFEVLAFIDDAIGVAVYSDAMHVVVLPFAVVLAAVLPRVLAEPVDAIIEPLAVVNLAIGPGIFAITFLLTVVKISIVY